MSQSFPKIKIITVGKVKKRWLKEGVALYVRRLPEVEIVEIKDSGKEKEADKERAWPNHHYYALHVGYGSLLFYRVINHP